MNPYKYRKDFFEWLDDHPKIQTVLAPFATIIFAILFIIYYIIFFCVCLKTGVWGICAIGNSLFGKYGEAFPCLFHTICGGISFVWVLNPVERWIKWNDAFGKWVAWLVAFCVFYISIAY